MVAAAWWYYTVQKQETEAEALRELFAIAQGKTDQIANWRRERIGDGRVLMSSPVMRIARRVLSNRGAAEADRADLVQLMRGLTREFLYADVTLVDLDGSVRIRLNEDRTEGAELKQPSRRQLAREAARVNGVVLSDLSPIARDGRPMMSLTIPVSDLGAFILDIDPSRFLYPYLETWPGSRRTAEALLVRIEKNGREPKGPRQPRLWNQVVNLSRMRNAPGTALFSVRPINVTPPPDAVLDAGWSFRALDYRGVPVLSTVRRVPDSQWYLICKMDLAEIDAPLRRLAWEMALITALIGLVNTAGVGLIWRGQRARFHQEREAWFYAVANDTPAYLWMTSAGEENSFINVPFRRFLGTDQERLLTNWTGTLHPDDADRVHTTFLECLGARREYSAEFRIRRFDGEYRQVITQGVPRFSPKGEFLGYAGSLIDVTGRRQAEEHLRTANATLASELAERTRKEQEIQALSARLIGAQEEERKRLARELHDDLNQQIAALSIGMGNLKKHIPEAQAEARGQSDRIHQKLVQLAETVRSLSHDLHPAVLQYSGLAAALRAYCDELTDVRVSLHIHGSFDGVPSSAALCIYRITQEALKNVAKHAKVGTATVELGRAEGRLHLTVSDTGVGIQPAGSEPAPGLGLVSIKERTRLAGGRVRIESQPNHGTTITVSIPDGSESQA